MTAGEQYVLTSKAFREQSDIKAIAQETKIIGNLVNNLQIGNDPDAEQDTNGNGFITLTGDDLAEYQSRFIKHKYYLADMIGELQARAKFLDAYIKDYKARNWIRVQDEIKEREGKVKNKEMIENELLQELAEDINKQIFYEAEYQKIRAKSHAIENVLVAISQRISDRKRELEMSKNV